ncbi:hypothetical protein LB507_011617 [Fusarium sp. FIESC RH6]|nr:hypothetical protein LB507_011617 [Fusarium sp. FIESC RH6]
MISQQNANRPAVSRQGKWSPEEDALVIHLRGKGMKWEDISKRVPGRSAVSCRLHYQNYLEKRSQWDEQRKDQLAVAYERFKPEMWAKVAEEMGIPWRAAEAMHWQLGEADMARRADVVPFSLVTVNVERDTGQTGPALGSDIRWHTQGTLFNAPSASPQRDVYKGVSPMAANSQAIIPHPNLSLPSLPFPMEPDPEKARYAPALGPFESERPPVFTGTLPGVAEVTSGVGFNSTPTAAGNMGAITRPDEDPLYSSHDYPPRGFVGTKRKASPSDLSQNKSNLEYNLDILPFERDPETIEAAKEVLKRITIGQVKIYRLSFVSAVSCNNLMPVGEQPTVPKATQ